MQKLKHFSTAAMICSQRGSVLGTVLPLSIVMSIAILSYLQVAVGTANSQLQNEMESKSFWAAESGLNMGAVWLCDSINKAAVDNSWPYHRLSNILPGLTINGFAVTIDVACINPARINRDYQLSATVHSNGSVGYDKFMNQNTKPVIKPPFDTTAFDYAIVSGGDFSFSGCDSIYSPSGTTCTVHANDSIVIKGNVRSNVSISSAVRCSTTSVIIQGCITAPSIYLHRRAVVAGGTVVTTVPPVPIPQIDLTPWYEAALDSGEVHTGLTLTGSYTPAHGPIVWVNGNATLSGGPGTVFRGMLIATGNIVISGAVSIESPRGGFALASRDGNITVSTSGTIKGLVYTKSGDFSQTSNGRIEGQIIANNDVTKGGTSDIVVYTRCIPFLPGTDGYYGVALIAGTWSERNIIPR